MGLRANAEQLLHRRSNPVGAELDEIARRVGALERAVQKDRRLHRTLAELTDLVESLVVSRVAGGEAARREALEEYRAGR